MSVGFYIATSEKVRETEATSSLELLSLNDLKKLVNYPSIQAQLETNLGIDLGGVDHNEKLFVFPNKLGELFSVTIEKETSTIHKYTNKPYLYYVDIYEWEGFYDAFSHYLKSVSQPFELWKIWEDRFEPNAVKVLPLTSLTPAYLEKTFGINEYLTPIMGIFH